jgi:hypothetical protein
LRGHYESCRLVRHAGCPHRPCAGERG